MRVLLFTGKGGVGKTSIAAATALELAHRGHETLVISTDPAHSLGDVFQKPISNTPTPLAPHLAGQEITVVEALREYWSEVKDYLLELFAAQGVEDVSAEELAILPGFDELASILYVDAHHQAGKYDALVVDTAPTGASLKLLSLPEMAQWYMERVFQVERGLAHIARPLARAFLRTPIPEDSVFEGMERLYVTIERAKRLLQDPETTSVRLVTNAEKLVIAETRRAYTYLSLYGYPTDALIVNRLLPEDAGDYLERWVELQEENLGLIEDSFKGLPILKVPLLRDEVMGVDRLREVASYLYEDRDPLAIYVKERPFEIVKEEAGRVSLRLKAPFLQKGDLTVLNRGGILVVEAAKWRRIFTLPEVLMDYEPVGAELEDDYLAIRLQEPADVA
ncbi:MAG: ArsA family ATPase [Thermoplasmata archaeon]